MADPAQLSDKADVLYNRLISADSPSSPGQKRVAGYKRNFSQADFQEFTDDTGATLPELLVLVQELQDHCLVRAAKLGGQLCWSTRPRHAAKAIRTLTEDDRMLYTHVEESREGGIWVKEIKKRANLPPNLVQKALDKLEKRHLIKSIKTVKSPVQKTYMLWHLAPSDDVTGGSFFDAGDLDESLIEELSNLIVFHVRMQSWVDSRPRRIKKEITISDDEDDTSATAQSKATKKRKRRDTNDIEDAGAPKRRSRYHDPETDQPVTQQAYPAYSYSYPTVNLIHQFLTTTGAIRASKAQQLTVAEIQSLIDVLVWDEKLEKIGDGYRTVRGVKFKPPNRPDDEGETETRELGNGLTQAPCGKCPVFDLCEEGGPVNARSCVYYTEWLSGAAAKEQPL